MRQSPTAAGVGLMTNFQDFFAVKNSKKLFLNVEKNQNILQPGMFFVESGPHFPRRT
jgi:hypothetical protein